MSELLPQHTKKKGKREEASHSGSPLLVRLEFGQGELRAGNYSLLITSLLMPPQGKDTPKLGQASCWKMLTFWGSHLKILFLPDIRVRALGVFRPKSEINSK